MSTQRKSFYGKIMKIFVNIKNIFLVLKFARCSGASSVRIIFFLLQGASHGGVSFEHIGHTLWRKLVRIGVV